MKKARREESSVGRKKGREENREGKARREESKKGRRLLGKKAGREVHVEKRKQEGRKQGVKGLQSMKQGKQ